MMPNERYSHAGVSFDPPAAWQNAQIVFYAPPTGKRPPSSIVIASEPMAECESLRAFVNRKLTSFARTNPGLELRGCSAVDVGGRQALRLCLLDRSAPGPTEQILVVVDTPDDPERRATIFSLGCFPEQGEAAHEAFDALLASVRFESPARVSGVPPPRTPAAPRVLPEMGLLPVIPIPGCRRAL